MIDPKLLDDGLLVIAFENAICDRQRFVFTVRSGQGLDELEKRVQEIREELLRRLKGGD